MPESSVVVLDGPGFYGKVAPLGDFVTRRLPRSFLDVWDPWLQKGLNDSRERLGESWLETYLTSPVWRFALNHVPGVQESCWGGILMPSVDRVGRYFPLTIACGGPGKGPLFNWLVHEREWYDRIETLARSSLETDFSFDAFDAELAGMSPLPMLEVFSDTIPVEGLDLITGSNSLLVEGIANWALTGQGLWWTEGSHEISPTVLLCNGLPEGAEFANLLDGRWRTKGL